ncbi:MAG: sulfur carrier protein ThiS [Bacteroidales bacterium]|jgi:sulfur carrier protein|nr:sulfur carrier protein ThiS [Bacteroidaceae bacterium]MBR6974495.1 sulfur carrier protein ThiS [Bacteroidaceae bacterium]MDO4200517.1 sulfur carrier protein ThiS [Bacteroidales bacterium]
MAKLIVNGEDQEVQLPATVADLIKQNNVAQPDMVSVQVNEEFVDREEFATLQLNEGDAVDFLYFMGGGQDKESIEYRF